jgi:hypothetical protein
MRTTLPKREQPFPLPGMQRSDRLQITIKDFGRKVVIQANRTVAINQSRDERTITILYPERRDQETTEVSSTLPFALLSAGAR